MTNLKDILQQIHDDANHPLGTDESMIAEQGQYGQWIVLDIINGQLVHGQYYGYTKKEALILFREEHLAK